MRITHRLGNGLLPIAKRRKFVMVERGNGSLMAKGGKCHN